MDKNTVSSKITLSEPHTGLPVVFDVIRPALYSIITHLFCFFNFILAHYEHLLLTKPTYRLEPDARESQSLSLLLLHLVSYCESWVLILSRNSWVPSCELLWLCNPKPSDMASSSQVWVAFLRLCYGCDKKECCLVYWIYWILQQTKVFWTSEVIFCQHYDTFWNNSQD